MSTSLLQAFPVELLYRILDNLDTITICLSFRYVCKRFHTITDTYNRYELDFEFVSKTEFELICRIIRPENVHSLILCESISRPNQMVLFHQLVDICRFRRLRSVTIDYSCESDLDNILEHICTYSLTSFSINIQKLPVNRFTSRRIQFHRFGTLPKFLSAVIAQPTLQKLYLHVPHQINEELWPIQCTLTYLTIDRCTVNQYCIILRRSPLLKTFILKNCDSLMKNTNEMSLSTLASSSFGQVTSLTLEKIEHLKMDNLALFLSLTPSLFHLQLTSDNELFNEFQWEQFIEAKLLFLKKFQFFFSYHLNGFFLPVDIVSIIVSFKTSFWLNKGWFVTCDYIERLRLIRVYSIPICVSNFYYVPDLDKVSYSTHYIINNDVAMMDNVHVLISDLATDMASIVPIKEKLLDRHLFRNVTRFEVRINDKSSIDSLRYLSLLIDFSHLVAVKLDIISNTRTSFRHFNQQSFPGLPFERNNHFDNSESKISIEKVCSMMPHHVKQLDVTVKSIDEMITILARLNHLYTVVFRFTIHFAGRPRDIIPWLINKGTYFTYHYEYDYLSIWLGKTTTHPLTMTPTHKRAKMLHRYDDF